MSKMASAFVAVVMVLGLGSAAFAQEDQRFQPTRIAIEESGVKVARADLGVDFRGKEALVLRTEAKMSKLVEDFRELHRTGKVLNGARVVGLAHIVRTDTWNITLRKGDDVTTFKVAQDKEGSRLTIRQPLNVPIRPKKTADSK